MKKKFYENKNLINIFTDLNLINIINFIILIIKSLNCRTLC